MTIPCQTCARPSECTRDRHCNCPQDLPTLIHRAEQSLELLKVAAKRAAEDMAAVSARMVIEKSRQQ